MQEEVWYSSEVKPKDNQKIKFKPLERDKVFEGLYIEQEDMFFVGFEASSSNFYFSWGIDKWSSIEEEAKEPTKQTYFIKINGKQFETTDFDLAMEITKLSIDFALEKTKNNQLLKEIVESKSVKNDNAN